MDDGKAKKEKEPKVPIEKSVTFCASFGPIMRVPSSERVTEISNAHRNKQQDEGYPRHYSTRETPGHILV